MSETKTYTLIGKDGKKYQSAEKGLFGGHRGSKVYGRMDCPSALRWLSKPSRDSYIKNRVFFKDEETALAAGYHPCYYCMREHFDLMKQGKLEDFLKNNH